MLEDEKKQSDSNQSLKMKTRILSSRLLLLSFLCLIPFISQDLNLISKPLASATITHHFSANSTSTSTANNLNLNQTTNSEEFLLNLVKNSYKTGVNANGNNNATSQSYSPSSNSASATSSQALASNSRLPPSRSAQPMHYQTVYGCEGNQMDFGCPEGKMIHVARALYGRFSVSICNEQGFSNYSVSCAAYKAFLVMEARCNKLSNCSVSVSEELFGDPCQGTPKYLEVQYYCYDANNHHNNQLNHQVPSHRTNQLVVPNHLSNFGTAQASIQQQHPPTNNNYPPQVAPPSVKHNEIVHKSQLSSLDTTTSILLQQPPKSNLQSSVGGSGERQQQPSDEYYPRMAYPQSEAPDQAAHYCPPQTSARNLHWNYTRAGRWAKQSCPEGSIGEASWLCDADKLRFLPQWSPDFSKCRLSWLERLSQQLDRMLESPGKQQQSAPEMARSHNEQILKLVLTDLTLMARTKELFSEDLERIDIMISQILAQFRSLSVVYGSLDSWRSPVLQGGARSNSFAFLYEDLFKKLISVVSSLFDVNQRSAWLEIKQASERQRLEQRFLLHLKEAGVLMANVFGPSLTNYQLDPIKEPNVFAAFAVINNNGGIEFASSSSSSMDSLNSFMTSEYNNELRVQMRQTQSSGNRFSSRPVEDEQQTLNEFHVHLSVLRELTAKGTARLLVIDVRKPNYALMRQQLESAYATTAAQEVDTNNWLSVLDGSQPWTTRVFGVFAILGENGDVLDGQQTPQHRALSDLLAQWPISIDFKSSAPQQVGSVYQPQVGKTCSALDLSAGGHLASSGVAEPSDQQPCTTYKVNATVHTCRCSRFGFVSLISQANQQSPMGQEILLTQPWPAVASDSATIASDQQTSYVGAQGAKLNQQQQPVGTWTTIFIALGLFLLIIFVAAFLINIFIRVSTQSRLNKKPGGFFSVAGLGRDLSGGPTTGPLVDHTLVSGCGGGTVPGDSFAGNATGNNGTTQSGSIIGLTQSAYQGYKTHQQSALYAAHLPQMGMCHRGRNRWLQWTRLLYPSRWFAARSKDEQMIQHRVIGSSLSSCKTPGSVSHKSTYQNGYTTAGLSHHQSLVNATIAAPSSSTSSYVSSSAYYEEIGPGNLTKVNTNQLANNNNNNPRTHTLVDPFKRTDQQQVMGQQATLWIQQPNSAAVSYPLEQSNYGNSIQHHQVSMMPVNGFQQQQLQANKQLQNNDLSQLQQQHAPSSAGSSGSQHSSSSTPRHYLFASPTAVSAYKNSMSQQQQQATTINHHHHCQQMQFKNIQDHRFMPN